MRRKSKIFFLILILILTDVYSQENYIVRSISFEGNNTLSADILLEQMEHYGTSWFSDVLLFQDPYLFSRELFNSDKKRIIQHYQREGFIDAEINSVVFNRDDESKTVDIIIKIIEGKPIVINQISISVDSSDSIPNTSKIKERLALKEGRRFRDILISNDKNEIINTFFNSGFPYVKASYSLELDTTNNLVSISWEVVPGQLSKFGSVKIEGNERTESELIKEKITFEPGQIYDGAELNRSQKMIYNLGLFHIVSVNAMFNESESADIPINIKLEEAPQFSTKFGIGYGRDEKFRVSLSQGWLGFLGGARQLRFDAKHSALEPYNFRINFLQPDFIWEFTNLSFGPYIYRQTEPGFTLNRLGGNISLQRPLVWDIFGSVKYTFERSDLDTNSISPEELLKFNISQIYNKSSIELGFERVTSEPTFSPISGSFASIAFHYSGLGLNSKYHFFRPSFDFRKYNALFDWLTVALRIKAGSIFSNDDDGFVPYEERFYSGGSSSNRGWGRAELGPKDDEGQPLGGKSVLENNIEFRYPIYSIVSGVAFLDFGNVWQSEFTYKLDDLRYASGLGIRVDTPIGPVRLDVATPIYEGAAKVQYFISVGHAF